jgi:hypothetical protein
MCTALALRPSYETRFLNETSIEEPPTNTINSYRESARQAAQEVAFEAGQRLEAALQTHLYTLKKDIARQAADAATTETPEPLLINSYVVITCTLSPQPRSPLRIASHSSTTLLPTPMPQPVYPSKLDRDQARAERRATRQHLANKLNPGTYVWCPKCNLQVRADGHQFRCGHP